MDEKRQVPVYLSFALSSLCLFWFLATLSNRGGVGGGMVGLGFLLFAAFAFLVGLAVSLSFTRSRAKADTTDKKVLLLVAIFNVVAPAASVAAHPIYES